MYRHGWFSGWITTGKAYPGFRWGVAIWYGFPLLLVHGMYSITGNVLMTVCINDVTIVCNDRTFTMTIDVNDRTLIITNVGLTNHLNPHKITMKKSAFLNL